MEKLRKALDERLEKAKYTKRTGGPGNYKYHYGPEKVAANKKRKENSKKPKGAEVQNAKPPANETVKFLETRKMGELLEAAIDMEILKTGEKKRISRADLIEKITEEYQDNELDDLKNTYFVGLSIENQKEELNKSIELMKAKYKKRTGSPGNYKYIYKENKNRKKVDKSIYKESHKNKTSPDGKQSNWTPEKGGVLFHGTKMSDNEKYLIPDKEGVIYLTNDFSEAKGYAKGSHLGGTSGGPERVLYIDVTSGKTIDINDKVEKAIFEYGDDDFGEIFDWARNKGASFVTYQHPSFDSDKIQEVIVALNPDDQLGPVHRGWDLNNNRSFRKYNRSLQ